jgi:hypothetical protein
MAISFIANALGGTTTTTSFSITLPATEAGDLIILEYTHRGTADGTIGGTYTGPAFVEKHDQLYASSAFSGKTLYSRATGNHSGQTVTCSGLTNSCAAIITIYRGVEANGDPLAAAAVVGEQNASGNETQAEITTLIDGAWVVLVVANSPDVGVSSQSCTSPGTLTERAERLSTGGTDTSISHASAALATAGATGAFTWTQTDGASGSWAYAIRPAMDRSSLPRPTGPFVAPRRITSNTFIFASNDLTAIGTLTISGIADLDAQGALAADGALSITGAADLDAEGRLDAAGTVSIVGAADLDAAGALIAAGTISITGAADLDAEGALVAAGSLSITGNADLEGISAPVIRSSLPTRMGPFLQPRRGTSNTFALVSTDIAAVGLVAISGNADLSATGSVVAAGAVSISGAAALNSPGELSAAGTLSISGAAVLSGEGSLTALGSIAISGSADLDASGALVAAGSLTITGAAALTAVGEITASGTLAINGTADLDSGVPVPVRSSLPRSMGPFLAPSRGTSNFVVTATVGEMGAVGSVTISGAADLDAGGSLAAIGALSITGNADIGSGAATVTKAKEVKRAGPFLFYFRRTTNNTLPPPSNDIAAIGTISLSGVAALTAVGSVAAVGSVTISGAAALGATGSLAAAGAIAINGSADLGNANDIVAAGSLSITGAAAATALGDVAAAGSLSVSGSAALNAIANLVAVGALSITGNADADLGAALSADGSLVVAGNAIVSAQGSLSAAGQVAIFGAAFLADANQSYLVGKVVVGPALESDIRVFGALSSETRIEAALRSSSTRLRPNQ